MSNWEYSYWKDTIDDGRVVIVTIQDIYDLIKRKQVPVQEIAVEILEPYAVHKYRTLPHVLDRVEKSNLDYPIIVIKTTDGRYRIPDGHHRLQKAINNKIPCIKAYVIELEDMPSDWQKLFKDASPTSTRIKKPRGG